MARDARGHVIAPRSGTVGRLGASFVVAAAEFGFTVEELAEYTARELDDAVARARGSQGQEDAEYTRREFTAYVRRTLGQGHD